MQTVITASTREAASYLRAGQTVIFPTETVYGLGANALDPEAVLKIYAAKNRPADNPLIVHVYNFWQVHQYAHNVPPYAERLMEKFMPGPFTILLPKKPIVPDATTAGSDKICLRMPSLAITQEFLRECSLPVAAPSANLSGKPSPTRWQDCLEDMDGRVAAILTGPDAMLGLESTIVDCTGSFPVLMRPGSVTFEDLRQVVPTAQLAEQLQNHQAPVLPGSKYRHYSPQATVEIISVVQNKVLELNQPFAYIGLTAPEKFFATVPAYQLVAKSVNEYAHSLFAFFRECDRRELPLIYAEATSEQGLGRALMNRLRKAAGS